MSPTIKKTHRTVENLDADHRARIVFVLSDGVEPRQRPTRREFKRRMSVIVQLRKLGYYRRSK
jgi:hypothetical protein